MSSPTDYENVATDDTVTDLLPLKTTELSEVDTGHTDQFDEIINSAPTDGNLINQVNEINVNVASESESLGEMYSSFTDSLPIIANSDTSALENSNRFEISNS